MKASKILIVDDMRSISELVALILSELNSDFEYVMAYNGKEACKLALKEEPDLIIMDWEMPEMSGIDALLKIKRNNHTKDIPVIMSSGFTESINIQQALEAGAIDYIRKPIDAIELIARVRSVLTLSSTYNKLQEQTNLYLKEKSRAEDMLKGYMPKALVDEILEEGFAKPKRYRNISVLFADLVDFTTKTNSISAKRLFDELNDIFPAIDKIMLFRKCTKVKTIGDAYLAACGMPEPDIDHATNLAAAALDIRDYIEYRNSIHPIKWGIRIGLHVGDVFGGLIGKEFFQFDVFGDSINTAARMQQHCESMMINVSETMANALVGKYVVRERAMENVKGKANFKMFYIEDHIDLSGGYRSRIQAHPLFSSWF